MLTPLNCADGIRDFLTDKLKDRGLHDEAEKKRIHEIESLLEASDEGASVLDDAEKEALLAELAKLKALQEESVLVYTGFLPYIQSDEECKKLCPAVVVRPTYVEDGKEETLVSIALICTTYDEDMRDGCRNLYNLLEFLRFELLRWNPINKRWLIKEGTMKTSIPDEQPFPQWWGSIDFDVYLMQPRDHETLNRMVR